MRAVIDGSTIEASKSAVRFDGDGPSDASGKTKYVKFAEAESNWFKDMAEALHVKPGLELHLTTGYRLRDCERYAAGSPKPPAWFLRSLLRSKGGWTYLAFVMDGSKAPWWLELQQAQRIFAALKQVK